MDSRLFLRTLQIHLRMHGSIAFKFIPLDMEPTANGPTTSRRSSRLTSQDMPSEPFTCRNVGYVTISALVSLPQVCSSLVLALDLMLRPVDDLWIQGALQH